MFVRENFYFYAYIPLQQLCMHEKNLVEKDLDRNVFKKFRFLPAPKYVIIYKHNNNHRLSATFLSKRIVGHQHVVSESQSNKTKTKNGKSE